MPLGYGRRQVARGVWREKFNESCELEGFEIISISDLKGDEAIETLPGSQASILEHEIYANAGLDGNSETAHLCEDLRLSRAKGPEDSIERAEQKVKVWPWIDGAPGAILRAWPK